MNIVWNSVCPWVPTGYGQQTSLFVPRIRDIGHQIAVSGFFGIEGTVTEWDGITVYPADATRLNKVFLRYYVDRHAKACGAGPGDVQVITLQDVWTWVDAKFGGVVADYHGLRLASWCPIDSDPVSPLIVEALRRYDSRPIAMSQFGVRALTDQGFDPLYVPHGIDTQAFQPRDKNEARRHMGIGEDRFVVGMVANNQGINPPRKAFPQVLHAFSAFLQEHDDAYLYLHTEKHGLLDGLNLRALAEVHGIPEHAIGFAPQAPYMLGEISQLLMSGIYSAMDVLVNTSYGEGFGIPIIEAQACGTPVIVTDWTSMPELVGAGWVVDGDPWYNPGLGSRWKCPSIPGILAALEDAYENRGDQDLAEKARGFAVQYDADFVTETYWRPVLEELDRPRDVAALPNRRMRRAAAKQERAAA